MRGVFVTLVLLAGCVQSRLTPCGDELLCPRDKICHANACVTQPQLDACSAAADGAACSFTDIATMIAGYCDRGYCRVARCGDGVVDAPLGEICDDGNDDNGDMCSADCRSLEDCGNGRVDVGTTEQCDDGNRDDGDGCQASCALPRCGDGILDMSIGEACDDGAANTNVIADGCRTNCQLARCGDGVIDSGEVCDDGNLAFGDGCRPDCASDESCGNGILDITVGETCDDGNTRARDGCSLCRPEVLRSRFHSSSYRPPVRTSAAAAYDPARQRTVIFGGSDGSNVLGDTWEWDGVAWRQLTPLTVPPARSGGKMVYDPTRHRVIMFGGYGLGPASGGLDDTWEWDGANWTKLSPTTSPPPRWNAAMAYDGERRAIVLVGGNGGGSTSLRDTWAFDGSTWTNLAPATQPDPGAPGMAYDPNRRKLVLFVGTTGRTYEWDGTDWVERAVAGFRGGSDLVFDVAIGRIVLHGVVSGTPVVDHWDGVAWTAGNAPTDVRYGATWTYDTARREIVRFGGSASDSRTNDLVRRGADGTWSAPAIVRPPARTHAAMAYDPVRGRVVMYGGRIDWYSPSVPLSDTWEWDGVQWWPTAAALAGRFNHAMAYDPVRQRMMMAGGAVLPGSYDGQPIGELWAWDGTSWELRNDAAPPARFAHTLAFDGTQLVLFGGCDAPFAPTNQLFGLSAAGWSLLTPPVGPPRHNHAMVYDPVRDRLVVDSGVSTWEWDGTTWTEVAVRGFARRGHSMTFDTRRARSVMLGESVIRPGGADVQEWDGTAWREVDVVPTISARYKGVVVYDQRNAEYLLTGGRVGTEAPLDETLVIGYQANTAVEVCTSAVIDYDRDGLAGCDDPDCIHRCAPLCRPDTSCTMSPRCGDGTCDANDDCRICPQDCGACTTATCGDFFCDGDEQTTCPADC